MDKNQLIESLRSLNLSELIEVMDESLKKYFVHRNESNGDFEEEAVVLARVIWGPIDGVKEEIPEIEVLGIPHVEVSDTNWGDAICQQGKCSNCNSLILSVAKVAICPVCRARVECT